ncbi:hypothetical protein [Aurantiacibacter rhizosphaerae]|uniref:hypothetical protein n=1 Tax=Aurantiacibacter rhizosphaerae TaxID=2691582 RepID=UPI001923D562|nr:hypothetical protein [Aurantiacibacter rhizosphaerae]
MSKDLSREERLAAQLRANLKRRKAQKRAMAPNSPADGPSANGEGESSDLSKTDVES